MDPKIYTLPFTNEDVTCSLKLENKTFRMRNQWNPVAAYWELSLYDYDTNEPLVINQPLLNGVDILGQYPELGLNGIMFTVSRGSDVAVDPMEEGLGTEQEVLYAVFE